MARLIGGDLSRLRQLNALSAIRALRESGPLTLSALADRTGLSRPSTKEVTDELVALGWVEEVPPSPGTMGRPARRYRFRAENGYLAGVDIGGHNVRVAVADLDGRILAEAKRPVPPETPLEERLSAIEHAVSMCLDLGGIAMADLWTIAVGTTGTLRPDGSIAYSVAIPSWTGLDLGARLRAMFPCEVLVENDSRLAALGESRRGAARGASDVVFLHLGLGMGAGLIIGGRVHQGFGGAAGEIVVLPEARWLEATEHLNTCAVVPPGTPLEHAAGHTLAAARSGDPVALEAVERYTDDVAIGAAALALILDPQIIVLGGGFSRSADVLLPPLRERLERRCIRMPALAASDLGDECVVIGAIDYAAEHLESRLFTPDAGALPLPR
ncbi:ROK family transcriptional regulator [Bailinhaonella thermotolerans]|uniref:ROK family transcriptional regulator n=1 Tax=Bailinhaonella thermotolerans TaxID=1070861 RepID=A0A3A4B1M0_9ACTN|nr:ROK family transcriptional regulator [Bailinhaonella thermotolerans]RJL35635.1 ROK family transcriptional regulator [Bailinhaonella thermotolerans]